jgi:hypothetical protein
MRSAYLPLPGLKQIPAVGPVKNAGCPPPHTVQEKHHIQRIGNFVPDFVRQGQDAAHWLSVFTHMKNHFDAIDPVLASHFFDRNNPSPFYHFFTPAIL